MGPTSSSDLPGRKLWLVFTAVAMFVCLVFAGRIFETVGASDVVCIQSPVSGKMNWYTSPGVKWQGFGSVTTYRKLSTYQFEVPIRFNDGGHGTMFGSLNYELPLDVEHLTQLHIKYGSQEAIQKQLVETVTDKCVYMTGPLMSSKESYAEKRTSLIRYVEDQIVNGVYKTIQKEVRTKDPMTGDEKTLTVVEILLDPSGTPSRQEEAVLAGYGIKTSNFAVNRLPYDESVEGQIKQQQEITMKVQTAIASAKEAEQRAITTAKEGEANAAKAKWDQEVIKAKMVTEAQQKLEVSRLDAQSASQERQANILRGEGEAARRRLVMQADGALDPKLAAWKEVNLAYAAAIKDYKGNWVPSVVMGEGAKSNGANDLMDMFKAKTAKDLAVDMSLSGKDQTR